MCGRARCTLSRECVVRAAGAPSSEFVNGDKYSPVENMAPGSFTPVVYHTSHASRDARDVAADEKQTPQIRVEAMRWGLVPSFTKPHVKPDHFVMFNARSESLRERPAFRRLLETRRCVVLCDGYYEWQQVDKKEKQPFYCYRPGAVMKLAGLYDSWTNSDGDEMRTFTILTTDSAPQLQWLHTRMPVLLTDDGAARWTSDAAFATLKDLLAPYTGADLVWHPVDKRLGSTKFQSPDCAKKVDIKHAGDITSFFARATTEKPQPTQSLAVKRETHAVQQQEKPQADTLKTEKQPVARVQSDASPAFFTGSSPSRERTTQQAATHERTGSDQEPVSVREVTRSDGFVRASTLLGKRSAPDSPSHQPQQTRALWSSPTRASPSKKPNSKSATPKHGADKRQSSLLAFLQPK